MTISTDLFPASTATARPAPPAPDAVNHPKHYTNGGIECIDAIEAALGPEGAAMFCRGNAQKYLWRAGLKGPLLEDLQKARWYLNREIFIRERSPK